MKTHLHFLKAFTLIELIVVMAIVITLSIVGFVSYNSYVRDGRNTTREAHLREVVTAIDRFVFSEGRAPRCRGSTTFAACYFVKDAGRGVPDTTKAKAPQIANTSNYLPTSGGNSYGIQDTDWYKLNLKKNPADPRDNLYYLYATNGSSKYFVFAVKEETSGFSTMARGWANVPVGSPATNDIIGPSLGMATAGYACPSQPFTSVVGWKVTSGEINSGSAVGDVGCMLWDGNTAVVPYRW